MYKILMNWLFCMYVTKGRSIMKKYIISFMIFVLFIGFMQEQVMAKEVNGVNLAKEAKSAILIEQSTGKILFEKNIHEQLPPASLTKVMTLLILMEELDKGTIALDEIVRVSERAASMGGSQVFLAPGEEISVEDLLKSIAIASGNDASVAIAERISGSEEAFVKRMNEKAKELGLKNTKFKNSSGLPAKDQYTSAYDLSLMSKELLKYEEITKYTSIYEDYLRKGQDNEFWLVNTNKLVRFYNGVDGIKTGFTREAKYGLAATAKRGDMRIIAVVMGAETVKKRNAMVSQMLDYSFNHFNTHILFEKNSVVTKLNMLRSAEKNIKIITENPISVLYKKGESIDDIQVEINLKESINFPIAKGEEVGSIFVKHDGETISSHPLTVEKTIEKASYLNLFKRTFQKMLNLK